MFNADAGEPSGRLVEGPAGTFSGTTRYGGRFGRGSIFEVTVGSPVSFREMHAFSWPDGGAPFNSGLIQGPEGYLYGATCFDGLFGNGTIFKLDSSGRVTTVHDFDSPADGAFPVGELLLASDGRVYGTTAAGGANNVGTVFRVDAAGQFETLHHFAGLDGVRPQAGLIQAADGRLYGTTEASGASGDAPATIFRIDLAGQFESLHTLAGEEGLYVSAGLVEGPDGLLYGGSYYGGLYGYGTIFRVDLSGNLVKIHDVNNMAGEGSDVRSSLLRSTDGNLWGVTFQGGQFGLGTIFKIDISGNWTTVHDFLTVEAGLSRSPLTLGADGWMYGTGSAQGIPPNLGTVFRVSTDGVFELLWTMTRSDGRTPESGVTEGPDGNLYGTTTQGGTHGQGTLFRLSPAGALAFLHSFGPGAWSPFSPLTRATDGNLYGTVSGQFGFAYRHTIGGDVTVLHQFEGTEGSYFPGPLVEATDGDFYGVSGNGGAEGLGSLFRMAPEGAITTIHEFQSPEGYGPSSLVQGSDTKLYGTTSAGPGGASGSIFTLDLTGANFDVLSTFDGSNGAAPNALMQAESGDFFGTAYWGGDPFYGTVFRMDDAEVLTAAHSFLGTDGSQPLGGLIQAADGNLYGTTSTGGAQTYGTLFRMTTDGNLTTLWEFHGTDGVHPQGPLHQASDGALYGTAGGGFLFFGDGVIFRWLLTPALPTLEAIEPTSGPATGSTSIQIRGTHFQTSPAVTVGGVAAVSLGFDARSMMMMSPALTPGSLNDVVVTNPDDAAATLQEAWFADFIDAPSTHLFHDFIETLVRAGITAGCGAGRFCPANTVGRAQMAVLLLKSKYGAAHVPPPATGTVFLDVAAGDFAAAWIEELAALGVTGGCGGGNYCPGAPVTRAQMAVLLLKTLLGSGYAPPVVAQVFDDVPPGAFAFDWINDLFVRGVTGGCNASPLLYCPANSNTRGQMAAFLTRTFGL